MAEATQQKPKGLAAKMAAAMGEIGRVQKRGVNQAQGYKYARADDVAEAAREILSKYGIAVYPDVLDYGVREVEGKNGKLRVTWAKVAWTFADAENAQDVRVVNVPGEGQDPGDKGIYKAITGSMKYALMAAFLIPTGEGDPEHDEDEKPTAKAKPDPKASGDAAQKVRDALRSPAFRKQEAIRELNQMGLDVRATLKDALGRTFPDGEEIKLKNEEELDKLEKHVVLLKVRHNSERGQAAH